MSTSPSLICFHKAGHMNERLCAVRGLMRAAGSGKTSVKFRLTGERERERGECLFFNYTQTGRPGRSPSPLESSRPPLWQHAMGDYLLSLLEHFPSLLQPFPLDRWKGVVRAWRLQHVSWWCE